MKQQSGIFFILFLAQCFNANVVLAQGVDDRDAEEHFKHSNYLMAIPVYKDLLKLERDNVNYNYKLGLCYLRTNLDKAAAIVYLERAYKNGKYPTDLPYWLGYAYSLDYRFSDAIKILTEYKAKAGKDKAQVEKLINSCSFADGLMQTPINVNFENLGEAFNTEYPDYYPFVSGDETFIAFNSRRKTGKNKVDEDGYYNCDIYLSAYDGEKYSASRPAPGLNSQTDDQVVGMSPDGDVLFIFSQAQDMFGALYLVKRINGALGKKEKFLTAVNNEKEIETSGYMSQDGQTIFFASNRAGGMGGFDIWMVRKLPDGKWAIPQNCGPQVNTPGDEDFPSLSYDGSTLYFSSNGHEGMGGFDLFQVNWIPEDNSFVNFKNLGYPLNTPFDERTISFTIDGKHAYVSSARKGGKGDLDIYRVSFNEVETQPAIFNIKLPGSDPANPYLTDAIITVFDHQSGEPVGEYKPNSSSGKFTIVLQPGTYDIEIEATGYKPGKSQLKVNEFTMRMGVIDQEIKLEKE